MAHPGGIMLANPSQNDQPETEAVTACPEENLQQSVVRGASLGESGHKECKVTPTREVLGSGLRCPSMVAPLTKSVDLLKVQAHWPPFDFTQGGEQVEPRSERLAPRTSSRE
jgi:hypothetical protein